MLVYVDTTNGSTFSIVSNRRAIVLDIKQKIEKTQGIAVSLQDLYYNGEPLLINNLRLEECNIVNHSRLLLVLPGHKDYGVPPPNYITTIQDSLLGKNQDDPAMGTSNKLQMLHPTEHSQVPPSNKIEAYYNKGWPPMAKSNDDQILHQTKQSQVPPSNEVEAFFNTYGPPVVRSNDDRMLHQTEHSQVPSSNEAEDFFNKDWSAMPRSKESIVNSFSIDELLELFPESPLTEQDIRKMQGLWPGSTTEGDVNIQESSGRSDNNQDLIQRESYSTSNTFGNFSFGEDLPLSTERFTNSQCYWSAGTSEEIINKNQMFQTEQSTVPSNTFGDFSFREDRRLQTENFTSGQSYLPMSTTEDIFINKDQVFQTEQSAVEYPLSTEGFTEISYLPMSTTEDISINKGQVFQTEQSLVQSNSTEQMIKTPDLPVKVRRRHQVVQTDEKSQPIRKMRSLKIPPQKQRVMVSPYSRENKPVSKFPVNMNASENFEELMKELEKIQQRTQLNLPSSKPRELEDEAGNWASAPHPNQVSEAPPHNAPSVLELRYQLFQFASSFNRISMRRDYLKALNERLGIYNSTPERRRQILEGMRLISALQLHERPDSGGKACDALVDFIRKWDQQQD